MKSSALFALATFAVTVIAAPVVRPPVYPLDTDCDFPVPVLPLPCPEEVEDILLKRDVLPAPANIPVDGPAADILNNYGPLCDILGVDVVNVLLDVVVSISIGSGNPDYIADGLLGVLHRIRGRRNEFPPNLDPYHDLVSLPVVGSIYADVLLKVLVDLNLDLDVRAYIDLLISIGGPNDPNVAIVDLVLANIRLALIADIDIRIKAKVNADINLLGLVDVKAKVNADVKADI